MAKRKKNSFYSVFSREYKKNKEKFEEDYRRKNGINLDSRTIKSIAYDKAKEFASDRNNDNVPKTSNRKTMDKLLNSVSQSKDFSDLATSYRRKFYGLINKDKDLKKRIRKEHGWKKKLSDEDFEYVGTEDNVEIYKIKKHDTFIKKKNIITKIDNGFLYVGLRKSPKFGAGASIEIMQDYVE